MSAGVEIGGFAIQIQGGEGSDMTSDHIWSMEDRGGSLSTTVSVSDLISPRPQLPSLGALNLPVDSIVALRGVVGSQQNPDIVDPKS